MREFRDLYIQVLKNMWRSGWSYVYPALIWLSPRSTAGKIIAVFLYILIMPVLVAWLEYDERKKKTASK